ncbi:MAG: beta-lactamase family protein [Candidatus Aminicenantes bacterium]|nr:beta-lactamase family protein [Candidatus Aminicenantes bacterium]NLH75655.1 beta-lactamase family protein [Acidobacteriota bacterium]
MNRTRSRFFAALAAVFLAAAPAAPAAADIDPATVRSTVAGLLKSRGLVGLSVAVVENGATALAEGFGVRSQATGRPVATDTMFAIGSITKQFTAACVLLLAEDGKLAVTDKVAKWYPALTRASDITLLDLMNHVSGYADYYPLDFVDRPMAAATPSDEVIRRFATRPLDFEPGARYSYSNTGYLILGRVVEKVSGEPFGAFLDRRILKPLGMAHTVFEPDPLGPGCARGHMSFWLGAPEIVPLEGRGWVAAAGALFSTPSDLVTWDLALVDGKVLAPASFKLMTSPRRLNDGTLSNYGCGLAMGTRGGVAFLSHTGAVNGFHALNIVVPSTRSAAVLFSNLSSYSDTNAVFAELTALVLPKPAPAAKDKRVPPAPAASGIPAIAGPPAAEAAQGFFADLQRGRIDRSRLGEEFSFFLKDAVVPAAAARMKAFGEPLQTVVESIGERGGMEVSTTRLEFASGALKVLMYRTPDGKIQQIFFQKG